MSRKAVQRQKVVQVKEMGLEEAKIISPSAKIPAIGFSLEEIVATGLGVANNISIVGDPAAFIGNFLSMEIEVHGTINGVPYEANTNIADIIKSIDGGVGSLDQSPTYHKLINEASELFKYHSKNLIFDGVNLAGDIALIKYTRGKYRKAAIGKTVVDGVLTIKDSYLFLDDKGTITGYFKEIVAGSPYSSRQAMIEKGKEVIFGKVFPYISHAKEKAATQLPINILVSILAGIILFGTAYVLTRKERIEVDKYVTDTV